MFYIFYRKYRVLNAIATLNLDIYNKEIQINTSVLIFFVISFVK